MIRSKKFIIIAVLAALLLGVLVPLGISCTKAEDSGNGQNETEFTAPGGMQLQMNLDKVAAILGIDQQELEDALAQAREEMSSGGLQVRGERFAPPEGWTPPEGRTPPSGGSPEDLPSRRSPPEGQPRFSGQGAGGRLPEPVIARMAEILNIDQQTLEDAFAQAQSADSE